MADLEQRVAALEAAVSQLAERLVEQPAPSVPRSRGPAPAPVDVPGAAEDPDRFWLLQQLQERHPAGAVAFAGTVETALGQIDWQWGAESGRLLDVDWTPGAATLDALAHPVRLRLLQRVLTGTATTAELSEDDTLGTTGQLHHHLRALVAGGWLQSTGRGHWAVLPHRVIPLLVIVSATVPPATT